MRPDEKIDVEDAANRVYRRLAIDNGIDQPADREIPVIDRGRRQQAHSRLAAAVKADKLTLWFEPQTESGGSGPPEMARLDHVREYFEGMGWLHLGPRSSTLARSLYKARRKYFELAEFTSWLNAEFESSKPIQRRRGGRRGRKPGSGAHDYTEVIALARTGLEDGTYRTIHAAAVMLAPDHWRSVGAANENAFKKRLPEKYAEKFPGNKQE